ncbi:hypothetical protein AB4156_17395 [Cupriavidus sp. 2MCAB6]|uniref:hypothetical protein n=1 Tax=Cupriavidus sp. 2MCAB6 TaxID=3232981 RepID=UPI003F8FDCB6
MSVNDSEARLAKLSRQAFLSMWAYQNPFYDEGKELCDVLVVFGDDVIIMSDKVISYSEEKDARTAWNRWYRKAVLASVAQLRGALKTIKKSPETIHLDARISSPFPLKFPDAGRARYHLIAVAHGSERECVRQFGVPSLGVDSRLTDSGVLLTVGVHFPEFVHVINRTTLDALFECFDTTADLVKYLTAKETLFARGHVRLKGEEDLIGAYMRKRRPDGATPLGALCDVSEDGVRSVPTGVWSSLRADQNFLRRKELLAPSYLIDEVIEQLASEYFAGRVLAGQDEALAYHAAAFQVLAAEPRMARMLIGLAVADVLQEHPSTFWSTLVESADQPGVLYLWLIYPEVEGEVSDEELEATVGYELEKYILVAMGKFPESYTVFAAAIPNAQSARTSRAFRMAARNVWTPEMQKKAESLEQREGILSNIESTTRAVIRVI